MRGNQAGMLPQDCDEMDRATNHGPINQFNIPAQDQHAMLHSNIFDDMPTQGLNTPTFGLNNDLPTQFNISTQVPNSAAFVPNQGGSTLFNMPIHDLNAISSGQNQGSPNLFAMPYEDLTTLLHGQNQGANDIFHTLFPDHTASPEMVHAASGHHPDAQGGLISGGHGDGQGATSQLSMPSQDRHPQSRGQNRGVDEQNSPAQQPSSGAQGQHQGIAHSFRGPANEPNTRSHDDNQGGRRPNHASSAQSTAPRPIPGAHNPTSAVELGTVPRGRLNPVLNGLQTPILARPRSSNIQHSPPRRAFHSPITPEITADFITTAAEVSTTSVVLSPIPATPSMPLIPLPMTRVSTNDTEGLHNCAAREALIRQRLILAEYLKKLNLQYFTSSRDERNTLERDLAMGWGRPDANDNLQVLYAGELRLMEVNKLWDKYARGFRMCEEEIEELWGDLVVPDEERLPGEGAFQD